MFEYSNYSKLFQINLEIQKFKNSKIVSVIR